MHKVEIFKSDHFERAMCSCGWMGHSRTLHRDRIGRTTGYMTTNATIQDARDHLEAVAA